ncbi:MAG: formylglycine-generating enzyme family protein [Acidobacteriota bacterium]
MTSRKAAGGPKEVLPPEAFDAHPGSAPGRADLLRALVWGEKELEATAELLGFVAQEVEAEQVIDKKEPKGEGKSKAKDPKPPEELPAVTNFSKKKPAPAVFWQPSAREYVDEGREGEGEGVAPKPVLTDEDLAPEKGAMYPQAPPIVAWPRLRRALEDQLKNPKPRQEVDVEELVRQWSRGRLVRRIPYRSGRTHARVAFYLDRSERLQPFWRDQVRTVHHLVRHFGRGSLRRLSPKMLDEPLPALAADERLLILGDLGIYQPTPEGSPGGKSEGLSRWGRFGHKLRRSGVPKPVALMPCPRWRWGGAKIKPFYALDWSAPDRASGTARPADFRSQGRTVEQQGQNPSSATPKPPSTVEKVLKLASIAYRLEAGLVRAIRQLVPEADLGVEQEVWSHPALSSAQSIGIVIDPDQAKEWRRQWADRLRDEAAAPEARRQLAAVAELLGHWHRHVSPETYAAEIANLISLGMPKECLNEEDVQRSIDLLDLITRLIAEERGEKPRVHSADAWLYRLGDWCSSSLWRASDYRDGLTRAYRKLRTKYEGVALHSGMPPEMLVEDEKKLPIQRYGLWQAGDGLHALPYGVPGPGSLLALIEAREPQLRVDVEDTPPERFALPTPKPIEVPLTDRSLLLLTDVETLELGPFPKPEWAEEAGRDEFGFFASARIKEVLTRFRWIPPGRFLMGSPKGESSRHDWEMLPRPVVLTQGFWFGETPVVQALWEALGLGNPSRFQSPGRPVDQATWEEAQAFAKVVSERWRPLELRLPTEAEWEYACRAGTTTSTYVGELKILGFNNAPLLDGVSWYGGNSGVDFDLKEGVDSSEWEEKQYQNTKAGSREVGLKVPNSWGLYDTLGNVFEWCADYWAEGSDVEGNVVDPIGPVEGSGRVIRGGAWYSGAQLVRAAFRGRDRPGLRSAYLGFRLALDPGPVRGAQRLGAVRGKHEERDDLVQIANAGRRPRPEWSIDHGKDRFGRWAVVEVDDVRHVLRWIKPSTFWMGSPENEEGRWNDEGPRREVTLTKGFWLGQTPCTQALWTAVMENNPSRFVHPERPVEKVSWDDCQEFLQRIAEKVPGFYPRLPTEAEWEFACRAGRKTTTYAGQLKISEEGEAPLLDKIAWYSKNSHSGFDLAGDKKGSRIVKKKDVNDWGLYDMLGNVYEWCNDYWSDLYDPDDTVDPTGPGDGSGRVLRGGAWCSDALHVRAAYRVWFLPGYRRNYLGFRLALGPE